MVKICNKCKTDNTTWGGICKCGYYPFVKDDIYVCPNVNCKGILIDVNVSDDDLLTICYISEDPAFLEAMIKLKEDDIIEYNLKMAQFRNQIEEQKSAKVSNNDAVKCPKCGSTNIQIVSRKWSLLTGFMTNKNDRVCVNCKHKF